MKKLLTLLIITPLLLAADAHKYYLSVTDLAYSEEEQSVQIVTRLFYDDLEDVLQERYDKNIIVDSTYDQERLDKYLSKYTSQKLILSVNGTQREATFLGKTYEDDYVVCYIEFKGVEDIRSFSVENTLLTDLFPEQKNMVHTNIKGNKKSFLLTRENPKGLLNFSK